MKKKELIYNILYHTLVEIREESLKVNSDKLHKLSDLVHKLPLQLLNAESEIEFENLYNEIEKRAEPFSSWLENVKKHIEG